MRRAFTLVELILATALILLVTNFMMTLFNGALDVSQKQIGNIKMYDDATAVFSALEQDLRGIMTRNPKPGVVHFSMKGVFASAGDTGGANGWTRLFFMTTFPDARVDRDLNLEGTKNDASINVMYDGWVGPFPASPVFRPSGGLKEVCYFVRPDPSLATAPASGSLGETFLKLYRIERSPICRVDTGTVPDPGGAFLSKGWYYPDATLVSTGPKVVPRRVIADNVIYLGCRYLCDGNGDGDFDDANEVFADWDSESAAYPLVFPHYLEASLSLAASSGSAQMDGDVVSTASVSSSGTVNGSGVITSPSVQVDIRLRGDNFNRTAKGFIAVPSKGVLYYNYNNATGYLGDNIYRFNCVLAPGSPSVSSPGGNWAVVGSTFTRLFPVEAR